MNYSYDIKDEIKGAKHYEQLASKDKKNSATFKSMASDEKKHQGMLKALKNKTK